MIALAVWKIGVYESEILIFGDQDTALAVHLRASDTLRDVERLLAGIDRDPAVALFFASVPVPRYPSGERTDSLELFGMGFGFL